jgi:nitrogen fixation NifU-like protein
MFDELRELYQEVILDHGKNPRNYRELPEANCHARGDNPICGDKITVFLKLGDDGLIEDASFQGRGCAISQASASMMTEIIAGRTVESVQTLFERFHQMVTEDGFDLSTVDEADADAFERLQVLSGVREFPMRVKCATLAWHTMQAAVEGSEQTTTE